MEGLRVFASFLSRNSYGRLLYVWLHQNRSTSAPALANVQCSPRCPINDTSVICDAECIHNFGYIWRIDCAWVRCCDVEWSKTFWCGIRSCSTQLIVLFWMEISFDPNNGTNMIWECWGLSQCIGCILLAPALSSRTFIAYKWRWNLNILIFADWIWIAIGCLFSNLQNDFHVHFMCCEFLTTNNLSIWFLVRISIAHAIAGYSLPHWKNKKKTHRSLCLVIAVRHNDFRIVRRKMSRRPNKMVLNKQEIPNRPNWENYYSFVRSFACSFFSSYASACGGMAFRCRYECIRISTVDETAEAQKC